MENKLFLFDLDGTVLKVKTHKMMTIVDRTLHDVGLGHHATREKKFSGRTDKDIFYSYLDETSHPIYPKLKERYIELMLSDLQSEDVDLLEGVHDVCSWLINHNLSWGVLTGNYEVSGKQKILRSGFPLPVEFGIYGDHHASRTDLAAQAITFAQAHFKKVFNPSDIVIIGDTPKDISCAKDNGYIAVAVATGGFSTDDLAKHEPHFVLNNLSELPLIWS